MEKTGRIAQPVFGFPLYFSSRWRGEQGTLRRRLLRQSRQHLSLLDLHRLQCTRTDSEGMQNTGCNLRGGDKSLQHAGFECRVGDDQTNVRIAVAEAAVLSVLRGGVSVCSAVCRLYDPVGSAAIAGCLVE